MRGWPGERRKKNRNISRVCFSSLPRRDHASAPFAVGVAPYLPPLPLSDTGGSAFHPRARWTIDHSGSYPSSLVPVPHEHLSHGHSFPI